MLELS